ncbi:hypothetical protein FKM82_019177 [Ascaphus truei]
MGASHVGWAGGPGGDRSHVEGCGEGTSGSSAHDGWGGGDRTQWAVRAQSTRGRAGAGDHRMEPPSHVGGERGQCGSRSTDGVRAGRGGGMSGGSGDPVHVGCGGGGAVGAVPRGMSWRGSSGSRSHVGGGGGGQWESGSTWDEVGGDSGSLSHVR